jgi:hypothetical protein
MLECPFRQVLDFAGSKKSAFLHSLFAGEKTMQICIVSDHPHRPRHPTSRSV